MHQYRVEGVNQQTGQPMPWLTITARNELEAMTRAAEQGMAANRVLLLPWESPRTTSLLRRFIPYAVLLALVTAFVIGGIPGAVLGAWLALLRIVDLPVLAGAGIGATVGVLVVIGTGVVLVLRVWRKLKTRLKRS